MVLIFVDSLYIKKLPPMNFVWLGVLSLWPLIHYVYGIQYIQYMLYNIQYTSFSRECRLNIGEWFFCNFWQICQAFVYWRKWKEGSRRRKIWYLLFGLSSPSMIVQLTRTSWGHWYQGVTNIRIFSDANIRSYHIRIIFLIQIYSDSEMAHMVHTKINIIQRNWLSLCCVNYV